MVTGIINWSITGDFGMQQYSVAVFLPLLFISITRRIIRRLCRIFNNVLHNKRTIFVCNEEIIYDCTDWCRA